MPHTDTKRAALAARRRARAVELRSLRRTYQQIADAVLPCPEHEARGGIDPAKCAELHRLDRQLHDDETMHPVDCMPMYANRKGAQRAVEEGLRESYRLDDDARELMKREQLATADLLVKSALRDVLGGESAADRSRASLAALRAMERVARLTGLDAPTRVTLTPEEDEALAAALAELSETPLPDPTTLRES